MFSRLRNSPGTLERPKRFPGSDRCAVRRIALSAFAIAGVFAGCAGTAENRILYEHPEWGYTVRYPQSLAASESMTWRELRVEDSDLAFRGPGKAFMTISSECGQRNGDPAMLGRQLLVGLQQRRTVSSARFEFAGGQAFSQVVDAMHEDKAVRTKTVTLVRGACVVDWQLAASGSLAEVEAVFDAWWRGFDPGSMPETGDDVVEMVPR